MLSAWSIAFPFLWLGGWLFASVIYRQANGKPIIPRTPSDALFSEDGCSGRSLRDPVSRFGGARNCLKVYVQEDDLVVTPTFPFTLFFLPEIFGLEFRTPLRSVASIEAVRVWYRRALRLTFSPEGPAPIELQLHNENALIRCVGNHLLMPGNRAPEAPTTPRKRRGLTFFRLFMTVWGLGALVGAFSGLPDDVRYRRDGIEATGVFEVGSELDGTPSRQGVLSYSVAGRTYRLSSMYGVGTYKVGDTERIYYLPGAPGDAREAGYLSFDLLFFGLGLVALTLAIFGGKLVRRFT